MSNGAVYDLQQQQQQEQQQQQQARQQQQQQQSSNLWFDYPADADMQLLVQQLLPDSTATSNTPSSSSSNSSQQSGGKPVAHETAAVYSPWCLLQCVQLLQRYGPQVSA
jgi:hypothetical protein